MYTRRVRQKGKRHFVKKKPLVKAPLQQQPQQQDLKTQSLPRCQCDPNCTNPPLSGKSPFCATHAKKCTIRSPLSGWEPIYMPSLYNGTKDIQHNHNCFAYAFDVMDPPTDCTGESCKKPFHQPGYAAGYGKIGEKKFCAELLSRLKGDMPWIKITKFITPCKPGYSKIAIVIDPNNDYHFYRQDSNGFWSHKPGGQPVTNLDASNKLIYNPEFCNRDYRTPGSTDPEELNYSIFCSFLEVPRNRPVHAKRGGGFILGDASSMKGGGTRKLRVKKTLKGGVRTAKKTAKKTTQKQTLITGITPFSKKYRSMVNNVFIVEGITAEQRPSAFALFQREFKQKKEIIARENKEYNNAKNYAGKWRHKKVAHTEEMVIINLAKAVAQKIKNGAVNIDELAALLDAADIGADMNEENGNNNNEE